MYEAITGTEIVDAAAGGKPFWRLGAADLRHWIDTLPPSATEDRVSRVEWIGVPWDGVSDAHVGLEPWCEALSAADIHALLSRLQSGIAALGAAVAVPPDASCVRNCAVGSGDTRALVVDVDMGDFILPLAIDGRKGGDGKLAPMTTVADRMLDLIVGAHAIRPRIVRRELALRRALEAAAARIGDGAAPLWLRLAPIAHYEDPAVLTEVQMIMLTVTLNETLVWAPAGSERVFTTEEIREFHRDVPRIHSRRAAARRTMEATPTAGWMSPVALAVAREHGRDPITVLEEARAAALSSRTGVVGFERDGRSDTLHYRDGVVDASLSFKGGHYHDGRLTIHGNYPDAYVISAKGRRFSDFVGHPAFEASGVVVRTATAQPGGLEFVHAPRNIAITRS